MAKHGEQLETSKMYLKQLYGYIDTDDVLKLECVKQELFPDYKTIKKQLAEQIRRC